MGSVIGTQHFVDWQGLTQRMTMKGCHRWIALTNGLLYLVLRRKMCAKRSSQVVVCLSKAITNSSPQVLVLQCGVVRCTRRLKQLAQKVSLAIKSRLAFSI